MNNMLPLLMLSCVLFGTVSSLSDGPAGDNHFQVPETFTAAGGVANHRRYTSGYASASASSYTSAVPTTSTPTATPTAAPTKAPAVKIVQEITFSDLGARTDAKATVFEVSWGTVAGIYDTSKKAYFTDCSVTSVWSVVTRRASTKIAFTGHVSTAKASAATASVGSGGSMTKAALTKSIEDTKTLLGGSYAAVATPTISDIATPAVTDNQDVNGAARTGVVTIFALFGMGLAMLLQN
jgi:hypothetical protein